jgi:hypothetical protein
MKVQRVQSLPSCCLVVGRAVNHVIPQPQVEDIPYDRRKHALEYAPLYRGHTIQLQELGESHVSVGQGQYLSRLPLQNPFHEYLCESFMHFGSLIETTTNLSVPQRV